MQKRPSENDTTEISISYPPETLEMLKQVADRKDLPLKALIKFYIGQGLRQDLSEDEARDLALKRFHSRKSSPKTGKDLAA